jgi:hypothetical protein
MMNIEIKTEKRNTEKKNESAIQLYVNGKFEYNIWVLKDKEITDQVLKAIQFAVHRGIQVTKDKLQEMSDAL